MQLMVSKEGYLASDAAVAIEVAPGAPESGLGEADVALEGRPLEALVSLANLHRKGRRCADDDRAPLSGPRIDIFGRLGRLFRRPVNQLNLRSP